MNAELNIPADFTGRILIHVECGKSLGYCPLRENEFVSSLAGFIEAAKQAGWSVSIPTERKDQ